MKNLYTYLFTILVVSANLTSCDDAIDLQPVSDIDAANFYRNAGEVNLALIGAYSSLRLKQNDEWLVTEVRSDNTQLSDRNSELVNVPQRELDRFTLNSLNIYAESYWRASYKTVGLANNILENLAVVTDQDQAVQFEGEARFLRAHSMFNLVRLYGGVFIVDRTITPQESKSLERKSVEEVYEFILTDLQYAYDNLPESYGASQRGRATKWAAGIELGKALLTEGSPANKMAAETVLREVVNMSGASLLPSYAAVFSPNNELNNEIFFAVRYQSGLVGLGGPFANFFAPLQSEDAVVFGGGDEFNVPTFSLINSYTTNDPRPATNFATSWVDNRGNTIISRFVTKYNGSFNNTDDAPNDWIISRYADALLLLAEAINENSGGPTGEAYGLVNQVKTRAQQPNIDATTTPDFFAMKLELEQSRRKEFAFENHRWFDLVRTGRAITVMNNHFLTEAQYNNPARPQFNTQPIGTAQLLLPIPQYEIDLNPTVAQNVGY